MPRYSHSIGAIVALGIAGLAAIPAFAADVVIPATRSAIDPATAPPTRRDLADMPVFEELPAPVPVPHRERPTPRDLAWSSYIGGDFRASRYYALRSNAEAYGRSDLLRFAGSDNPQERQFAMLMLGDERAPNAAVRAAIVAGMSDPDDIVRLHALSAVMRLGKALQDDFVAMLGDEAVAYAVPEWADDGTTSERQVRRYDIALTALLNMPEVEEPPLWRLAISAAPTPKALENKDDPSDAPPRPERSPLADPWGVRERALLVLAVRGREATPRVHQLANDPDSAMQYAVANVIARSADSDRRLKTLVSLARSANTWTRDIALDGLVDGGPAGQGPLQQLVRSDETRLAGEAFWRLDPDAPGYMDTIAFALKHGSPNLNVRVVSSLYGRDSALRASPADLRAIYDAAPYVARSILFKRPELNSSLAEYIGPRILKLPPSERVPALLAILKELPSTDIGTALLRFKSDGADAALVAGLVDVVADSLNRVRAGEIADRDETWRLTDVFSLLIEPEVYEGLSDQQRERLQAFVAAVFEGQRALNRRPFTERQADRDWSPWRAYDRLANALAPILSSNEPPSPGSRWGNAADVSRDMLTAYWQSLPFRAAPADQLSTDDLTLIGEISSAARRVAALDVLKEIADLATSRLTTGIEVEDATIAMLRNIATYDPSVYFDFFSRTEPSAVAWDSFRRSIVMPTRVLDHWESQLIASRSQNWFWNETTVRNLRDDSPDPSVRLLRVYLAGTSAAVAKELAFRELFSMAQPQRAPSTDGSAARAPQIRALDLAAVDQQQLKGAIDQNLSAYANRPANAVGIRISDVLAAIQSPLYSASDRTQIMSRIAAGKPDLRGWSASDFSTYAELGGDLESLIARSAELQAPASCGTLGDAVSAMPKESALQVSFVSTWLSKSAWSALPDTRRALTDETARVRDCVARAISFALEDGSARLRKVVADAVEQGLPVDLFMYWQVDNLYSNSPEARSTEDPLRTALLNRLARAANDPSPSGEAEASEISNLVFGRSLPRNAIARRAAVLQAELMSETARPDTANEAWLEGDVFVVAIAAAASASADNVRRGRLDGGRNTEFPFAGTITRTGNATSIQPTSSDTNTSRDTAAATVTPTANYSAPGRAPTSGVASLPRLPSWPPPGGFRIVALPQLDRALEGQTLADAREVIVEGLERAASGFEWGLFSGPPGGFALLARTEQINKDGQPARGLARWATAKTGALSAQDFLRDLFFQKPGYYRTILFVVSDEPNIRQGRDGDLPAPAAGAVALPMAMATRPMEGRVVQALVYAYQRRRGGDSQAWTEGPSAREHLAAAGLSEATFRTLATRASAGLASAKSSKTAR